MGGWLLPTIGHAPPGLDPMDGSSVTRNVIDASYPATTIDNWSIRHM